MTLLTKEWPSAFTKLSLPVHKAMTHVQKRWQHFHKVMTLCPHSDDTMFTKLGHHVHTQMPSVKLMFTKPWPCDHKGMGSMFTQRCPLFSDVHKIMTVIKMLWHHVHTGMPSVHTDVYKVMTLHSQSDDPVFTKWWPCIHKVMTLRSQSDDPAFTKLGGAQ